MITRQEVYDAIDGERDYQKKRWGEYSPVLGMVDQDKAAAAFLCYMQSYLSEAIFRQTKGHGKKALHAVRKVVALGVACLEQHGVPTRADEEVSS